MFETILVCLDGSPFAEQIIPYAAEEAGHFKSKLTLLRVFHSTSPLEHGEPAQEGGMPPSHPHIPSPAPTTLREEEEAQAYLESAAAPLRERGLKVEIAAVQAGREKTGETIVRYAQVHEVGLVAIATHGEGGLKRLAFGSVADHVLRNLGRPVLLIRPGEAR